MRLGWSPLATNGPWFRPEDIPANHGVSLPMVYLVWIGVVGTDAIATLPIGEEGFEVSSLWLATGISLVTAVAIFRTV